MPTPEPITPSAAVAAPAKPSKVYRHAGFVSFLIARVVAVVATQVQAVVVAWQVYDLTRQPLALAYVGLAQFLPMLALLLPAGDLIDRFDRKRILALAWSVGGVCSALLWWLSGDGSSGVGAFMRCWCSMAAPARSRARPCKACCHRSCRVRNWPRPSLPTAC